MSTRQPCQGRWGCARTEANAFVWGGNRGSAARQRAGAPRTGKWPLRRLLPRPGKPWLWAQIWAPGRPAWGGSDLHGGGSAGGRSAGDGGRVGGGGSAGDRYRDLVRRYLDPRNRRDVDRALFGSGSLGNRDISRQHLDPGKWCAGHLRLSLRRDGDETINNSGTATGDVELGGGRTRSTTSRGLCSTRARRSTSARGTC